MITLDDSALQKEGCLSMNLDAYFMKFLVNFDIVTNDFSQACSIVSSNDSFLHCPMLSIIAVATNHLPHIQKAVETTNKILEDMRDDLQKVLKIEEDV